MQTKILVAYTTNSGSTRDVAEFNLGDVQNMTFAPSGGTPAHFEVAAEGRFAP